MQNAKRYFFLTLGAVLEGVVLIGYAVERSAEAGAAWAYRQAERGG